MGKKHKKNTHEGLLHAENAASQGRHGEASTRGDRHEDRNENPPRTTSGWLTTPKFGSSTSGGGEIEPGPERD
ncbi:MAG TPA: hypothetical protein VF042_11555 [Gemmatimonadaceae bacterium]